MLPAKAIEVVPFDKGEANALGGRAFLGEQWKRAFSTVDSLESNLGYLEARLHELLRPAEAEPLVTLHPSAKGAAPFTQRLADLLDRLEEQVMKVESLQRRLDV